MIRFAQAGAAMAALLALAACNNVTVNNESVDNKLDAAGDRIGNAADSLGNAAESAGAAVENEADKIGDRVDNMHVNVDLNTHDNNADDPD